MRGCCFLRFRWIEMFWEKSSVGFIPIMMSKSSTRKDGCYWIYYCLFGCNLMSTSSPSTMMRWFKLLYPWPVLTDVLFHSIDKLTASSPSKSVATAKTINPIAFFNIIQEGTENDVTNRYLLNSSVSTLVLLIAEQRRSTKKTISGMRSVFPLVFIPSSCSWIDTITTPTTTAVICATLSHMNESWDKDQVLCLYGSSA